MLYTGREFKALFISTVECVHDGFKSANPTKSFCNSYVFNTALTRAQSLVVVAGNPFLLLKVEAAMPQPMGCWREYLRRCIDNDTLIVPEVIDTNSDDIVARLKEQLQTEKGTSCFSLTHFHFSKPYTNFALGPMHFCSHSCSCKAVQVLSKRIWVSLQWQ